MISVPALFQPPEPDEGLPHAPLVWAIATISTTSTALPQALIAAQHGFVLAATLNLLAALTTLALLLRHQRVGQTARHVRWVAYLQMSVMLVGIWGFGGFDGPMIGTVLVPPVLVASVGQVRQAIPHTLFAMAGILALLALEAIGIQAPDYRPPLGAEVGHTIVNLSTLFQIWLAFDALERTRQRDRERLLVSAAAATQAQAQAVTAHAEARAVLDHVDQGLALVDRDGQVLPERSRATDAWFGTPDAGTLIWDYLLPPSDDHHAQIAIGFEQLTDDWMPAEVAIDQLPARIRRKTSDGVQELALNWSLSDDEQLVLLVILDITERRASELERAAQQEALTLVSRWRTDRHSVVSFTRDAARLVDALLEGRGSATQDSRWLHTLKGNSGVMGLETFASWLHDLETLLLERGGRLLPSERTELRTRWLGVTERINPLLRDDHEVLDVPRREIRHAAAALEAGTPGTDVARELRYWTWDPIDKRLELLAEQARRIATTLDKVPLDIHVDGHRLRTPPERVWESMWSAMVHLVRNAVDHGLEADRAAVGKPNTRHLELLAEVEGDRMVLTFRDDGQGIDWGRLGAKAQALGLPFSTHDDKVQVLFTDGISSREEASETSGRGVGTAAVLDAVEALGGAIEVASSPGVGTTFSIRLPLPSVARNPELIPTLT